MASRLSHSIIIKEGFLYKKGGIIKSWSRRFFVLSHQSLCYFRSEDHDTLEPLGRIFLSDIVSISTESTEKKKAFVFVLHTKKRAVLLQGSNTEDRDKWVQIIKKSLETDKEAEKKDPFRKSLRKLTPGIKRVTLFKDPHKGIGCTIKNAAGHIFVNRILEDGPIAETGVLRPGDELLEIHGTSVSGLSVGEVVEIIRKAPNELLATVRPVISVHKALKQDFTRINYSDIVFKGPERNGAITNGSTPHTNGSNSPQSNGTPPSIEDCEYAEVNSFPNKSSPTTEHKSLSYEDVGNYDDEDEGDFAPPLPPWTEDALILVDPPPLKPKFDIYKTNAHLPPGVSPKRLAHPFHTPPATRKDLLLESTPPPKPVYVPQYSTPTPKLQHSPPHQRPARPPRLFKAHSQGDGLDKIDSQPPVLPPRPQKNSPNFKPRRRHQYEDIPPKKPAAVNYIDVDFTTNKKMKY